MRPTKRTRAVKKPRKVTPKKAHDGNSVLGRLMKLKYRINDAYKAGRITPKSDKTWVMEEITNLRQGGWLSATKMKIQILKWRKRNVI